jgi:hypothetical protein
MLRRFLDESRQTQGAVEQGKNYLLGDFPSRAGEMEMKREPQPLLAAAVPVSRFFGLLDCFRMAGEPR